MRFATMRPMDKDTQQARYRDNDEQSTQQRAAILGINYYDTRENDTTMPLATDVLDIKDMYRARMVPLRTGNEESSTVVGITSNTPQSITKQLKQQYVDRGETIEFLLISNSGYRTLMQRYDPPKEVVYDDVKIASEGDSDTLGSVSATLESVSSDKILTYLIEQADKLNASDIHIECQRQNVRIRLRVDGALHPIATITHEKYRVLFASIASKANISTAASDAQTGHMQHDSPEGHLINMRIETIPTIYGQDAVIRMFNFNEELLQLENLGLDAARREKIDEIVAHPTGMVMVVGPTGSGKSTTLYSMLNALNDPSRKLLTLEDPVEYSLTGISQIPVMTEQGDSFAEKLRAVLRLDPDVVMVGEIRDVDTARTAIQASITGHLVLSTFHAASAAAAFSRIIDMIGQNPIFANAIRMVMSQRLVRRLDDQTKTSYQPDDATKRWVQSVLKDVPAGTDVPNLESFELWQPGSSTDVPFGYKGRIIVMEQMIINERIQQFLRGEIAEMNVKDIEAAAKADGMMTMLQDGVLRALKGETTLEEINRVL